MRAKLLPILLLTLLSSLEGLAQKQEPDYNSYLPKKFFSELELFVGPAASTLRGWDLDDHFIDRKIKIGYTFGLGVSHYFNRKVKITGKLFFERKGVVAEVTGLYFDEETQTLKEGKANDDYNFNYYTFSILPCYVVRKLELGVGPYVGYLNKMELKKSFSFNATKTINDYTEDYTQFDFGIAATVGYKLQIKSNIDLNFRLLHTFGLIEIAKHSPDGWATKTTNTSILIGISFKR